MDRKIMLLGPSGSGKTTLAKAISHQMDIAFLSGSYSDLIPTTKGESHQEMMHKQIGEIYSQDHQLLSMRAKLFGQNDYFITDRSYMDNLAYFILKLSKDVKQCDTESFRDNVITLMDKDCTDLIFVPFTDDMIGTWKVEDNGKRVTNIFFQWQVSQIMYGLIRYFGFKKSAWWAMKGIKIGYIEPLKLISDNPDIKKIRVLVLNSPDYDTRIKQIKSFLNERQ